MSTKVLKRSAPSQNKLARFLNKKPKTTKELSNPEEEDDEKFKNKSTDPVIIKFWKATEVPYGRFSNYYVYSVTIDGKTYKSTEHYYQQAKFTDPWFKEQICNAATPHQAKCLAGQKKVSGYRSNLDLNPIIEESIQKGIKIRADWKEVREDEMRKALRSKFGGLLLNGSLRKLLLGTKSAIIQETNLFDEYWATGENGNGQNRLGHLLMELRQELLDDSKKKVTGEDLMKIYNMSTNVYENTAQLIQKTIDISTKCM